MSQSGLWIPKHLRPANKPVNVVFYHSKTIDAANGGRVMVGFPEQFPAPKGFVKIVCRSAAEVEKWSEKLRQQERRDDQMTDEQREAVEGPIRDYARKQLLHLMANARNQVNRDFCKAALDLMDKDDAKRRMKRESFMHIEAAEDGK